MTAPNTILVAGAGPVGCLLATLLARRGFAVTVFEKRPDMRRSDLPAGRSINLVLTRRGLAALELVGLREEVLDLTVPVLGRMMHDRAGNLAYQPYGKDESECNYSVSRGELNKFLLSAAEAAGVTIHFDTSVEDVDFDGQKLLVRREGRQTEAFGFDVLFGADGAPSPTRQALVRHKGAVEEVEMMRWGYKELLFPAAPEGGYAMAGHALHIWPRGHHFLMGLANLDGSFTGTVYLPLQDEDSFEELENPEKVRAFFSTHYADALELLGDFVDEFLDHPVGHLGTVRCAPWHFEDRLLLIGDAAHGIVPFFGQGLNSGFEDCTLLDELLHEGLDAQLFSQFYERRKSDADAIATMALENFVEMSEKVGDPHFLLKKKVEARLEQTFSELYRSRYAMVMYSHIPYRIAYEIGEQQKVILELLTANIDDPAALDLERARELIQGKLAPLYAKHRVSLDF